MAFEDKSSQSADLKKLEHLQMQWLGVRGYVKITEEYDHDGKLSKVTREHQSGKTLWDWLQLLIIPFVIGAGAIWFNYQQNQQSSQASQMQHVSDQQRATDQQQATTLQSYIDSMQDLLLNHQLFSKYDFEIVELAQARTTAALSKLDPKRKGIVVQFLYTSGLIGYLGADSKRYQAIISLDRTDLTNADLTGTFLEDVDFSSDNLHGVTLTNADLSGANLSSATLTGADLTGATLTNADLLFTHLRGAIFANADLSGAYLSSFDLSDVMKRVYQSRSNVHLYSDGLAGQKLTGADLSGAKLGCLTSHPYEKSRCVNLSGADLSGATLSFANLSGADLSGADLSGADLSCSSVNGSSYCTNLGGTKLTNADLSGAKLNGAGMGCYRVSGNDYCADLSGANLTNADLSGAKNLVQQQLDAVSTCKGAILPQGLICHHNV